MAQEEVHDDADIQVQRDEEAMNRAEHCVLCGGEHEWINCPEMDEIMLDLKSNEEKKP